MATAFQDWPRPVQALVYVGLAFVLVAAGYYVPFSPIQQTRAQLQDAQAKEKPLQQEVANLRVYKQRRAELQSEMDALQKQLATLQTIVPEEKEADQFIIMIQGAAASSGVSIRRLTARPVVGKQYYFELPFEIQADGPYYSVLDFFARLGRLSRIINVGDLKLSGLGGSQGSSTTFHMAAGASVTGTFTITTFFTKAADQPAAAPTSAAAAPAKR
jgi:type IV pilus assembly protein PilO